MEILDAIKKVENAATKAKNDERFVKALDIGRMVRQGDVYLHKVSADHPAGGLRASSQLAEGQTIGARHIVKGDVKVYDGVAFPGYFEAGFPTVALGPVVDVFNRATLTHPEHADYSLPTGRYQVTYQIDARTRRAVSD